MVICKELDEKKLLSTVGLFGESHDYWDVHEIDTTSIFILQFLDEYIFKYRECFFYYKHTCEQKPTCEFNSRPIEIFSNYLNPLH